MSDEQPQEHQQPLQPNTIVVAPRDAESSSSTDETTPLQSGAGASNYLAGGDAVPSASPDAAVASPSASPPSADAASASSPADGESAGAETSGKDVEPVMDAAERAAIDPQGPSVPAGQEADGEGAPSTVAGSDAEGQRQVKGRHMRLSMQRTN